MPKPKRAGRKTGSRNRGFFYRPNRGWFTKDKQGKFVALLDESGERLRVPNDAAGARLAKAALIRYLTTAKESAPVEVVEECKTVLEVCRAYLAKAKEENGNNKTFKDRTETLFDFCFGLPARFRTADGQPNGKQTTADKVHKGYGEMPVCQLTTLDLDQWLQAHPPRVDVDGRKIGWGSDSTKRTHLKALITALNYGAKSKMVPLNPVRDHKVPKMKGRVTYITPQQEAALCEAASPALALAIKVLIRTGMRPGVEFAAVAARHVKDQGERLEIRFPKEETKTKRRERVILVTDPAVLAIIRQQAKEYPSGPVFRATRDTPWIVDNLSKRFREVRNKLAKDGLEFDKDCVLYSTRHTYAKRILQGFWSGRPTNLQTLSRLMGNTRQICEEHYTKWDDSNTEFLWASA